MTRHNVISIIMGGGRGTRLYPLTKYRCKPAVPLAGKYRLVDIPISNCTNSTLSGRDLSTFSRPNRPTLGETGTKAPPTQSAKICTTLSATTEKIAII